MARYPLLIALFMAACSCSAEPVVRTPGEGIDSFAKRFAPAHAEELVKTVESTEWNFGAPVIATFYRRSVAYADKSHYYGQEPNDYEVIGVLFVPVASDSYERVEIDSYGPEGSTAEIDSVHFDLPREKGVPVLVVHVSWHPRPGDLASVCAYLRPTLRPLPKNLVRAKGYDCHP